MASLSSGGLGSWHGMTAQQEVQHGMRQRHATSTPILRGSGLSPLHPLITPTYVCGQVTTTALCIHNYMHTRDTRKPAHMAAADAGCHPMDMDGHGKRSQKSQRLPPSLPGDPDAAAAKAVVPSSVRCLALHPFPCSVAPHGSSVRIRTSPSTQSRDLCPAHRLPPPSGIQSASAVSRRFRGPDSCPDTRRKEPGSNQRGQPTATAAPLHPTNAFPLPLPRRPNHPLPLSRLSLPFCFAAGFDPALRDKRFPHLAPRPPPSRPSTQGNDEDDRNDAVAARRNVLPCWAGR
ncbi:hypothetical protein CDD83_2249 [Cordyceps sp. RAO-2017]|nr:hypothetical protein CDD83_2249 [Cordyceps sp. RAO-2017]